jgi:hypothetical protein
MHFGVATRGLLPDIIGAKLSMTIQEKHVESERWLDVLKWTSRLYWVVHYF